MIALVSHARGLDLSGVLNFVVPFVVFAPLLAFAVILSTFRTRRPALNTTTLVSALVLLAAAVAAVALGSGTAAFKTSYQWINVALAFSGPTQFQGFGIDIGLHLDRIGLVLVGCLAAVELVTVVWSRAGSRGEPGPVRQYALVSLLLFAALGVLMSDDLAETFVFWALAGVTSYLLLTNRWGAEEPPRSARLSLWLPALADAAFLLAITLLYSRYGRLDLGGLVPVLHTTAGWGFKSLTAAAILLFAAAAGRAGVFPLLAWQSRPAAATPASLALIEGTWTVVGGSLAYRSLPIAHAAGPQAVPAVTIAALAAALVAALLALASLDLRRGLTAAGGAAAGLGFCVLVQAPASAAVLALAAVALARTGGLLATGNVVAAMRSPNLSEVGEIFRRLRTTSLALASAALALAVAPALAAAYGLRAAWAAPLFGLSLLLAGLGAWRYVWLPGRRPLLRRRAFDPRRVVDAPRSMRNSALAAAILATLVSLSLVVPGWLRFLGRAPAGLVPAGWLWLLVPAAAIGASFVLFDRSGEATLRLASRIELGFASLGSRARLRLEMASRAAAGTVARADEAAVPAGEARVGDAFAGWAGLARLHFQTAALALLAAVVGALALTILTERGSP